jgi:cyclopropane fatty-acyl-phospholipid synthase-like methyltransferase
MWEEDVPSPIDFHELAQAREWEAQTIAKRPWRPEFFAAFVTALNGRFDREFSVLELGSGPGHLAEQFLRDCKVARYVALDFSRSMHHLARARLGPFLEKTEFLQRDFRSPDWTAGLTNFDAVVTMQAAHELRHKRRLPAFLSQVRTCLAPGGLLLYCDHYAESASAERQDLFLSRAGQPLALREANFTEVRTLLDLGGMALLSATNPG